MNTIELRMNQVDLEEQHRNNERELQAIDAHRAYIGQENDEDTWNALSDSEREKWLAVVQAFEKFSRSTYWF